MAKEKFDFLQPFKDIPKTLKGFPKNLIRIWKEPVKNSQQVAERKAEIYPYLYLFVGMFLLVAVLCAVIPALSDILVIVNLIPAFGAVGCVFLLSILKKAQQKFSDLECPKCKEQISYSPDVKIDTVRRDFLLSKECKPMGNAETITKTTPMYIKITGKEKVNARITCKCKKCGAEKSFEHTFTTVECERFENRIPYVESAGLVAQFEQAMREDSNEGFENKSGTTVRGNKITYNRTLKSLVAGYFGNEIQMR